MIWSRKLCGYSPLSNGETEQMIAPAKIAVVIATYNRPHLMKTRTLPSVAAQTRSPDYLVVVDNSTTNSYKHANAELLRSFYLNDCKIIYCENERTANVCGAWNTAFDFLVEEVCDHHKLFVAILDDDDAWSPEYLAQCELTAGTDSHDVVATGLKRFEPDTPNPTVNYAPAQLRVEEFLVGNPGIQCSNLFLRFSALLAAGGFDEAIFCTTDRDLCIRIADLGSVSYGRVSAALLSHYADSDRLRLSTPGSDHKLACLTSFWKKYAGRMTADQRRALIIRSNQLFHWKPPNDCLHPRGKIASNNASRPDILKNNNEKDLFGKAPPHDSLRLLVGVITSEPAALAKLFDTLSSLISSDAISSLSVLVLNNSCPHSEIEIAVGRAQQAGLQVVMIGEDQQHFDANEGVFGSTFQHRPKGQVGIAFARTMLQKYLGAWLAAEPGSFGWILDDDMLVDNRAFGYLPWLPAFREQGTDVLIGTHEGNSPNPPFNGLRVNLIDLLHNLKWLHNLPMDAILPDRTVDNDALRKQFPDYYYDLSRKHTAHLEMPHWLEPSVPGETVKQALSRLLSGAAEILHGHSLTRPLISASTSDPLVSAKYSVNRGGNTFILNYKSLTDTPNMMVTMQGQEARRSDMVWAIVNQHYRRLTIKTVAFPVRHASRTIATPSLDIDKIRAEIMGSTLYAGLTEFLQTRPHHELAFTDREIDIICQLANKNLAHRWRMLRLNLYRIAGLRDAIRRIVEVNELQDLLGYLDEWITPELFDRISSGAVTHKRQELQSFLGSLRYVADEYKQGNINIDNIHERPDFKTFGEGEVKQ